MGTRAKAARRTKTKRFLVDENNRRVAVVLPIEEYDELIEAAEQREDIRHLEGGKKVKGKDIPLEEFEAQLRAEGRLP